MTENSTRWNGRMLACAIVLTAIVAGGGWLSAAAQREGVWVDIFFGTEIDRKTRAVIGESVTFPAEGDSVYCLTRVHGMSPPTSVTHVWYYEGKTMARVDLSVGSENWRTWSYKKYKPAWTGSWEVKVLNEDGMVLGSSGFEVK